MSISYDSGSKKWNVTKLKTDYDTSRPIKSTVSITVNVPEVYNVGGQGGWRTRDNYKTATVSVNGGYWDVINALNAAGIPNPEPWENEKALIAAQEKAKQENQYNADLNQQAAELNADNEKTNSAYDQVISLASRTNGGDYKLIRDQIRSLDVSSTLKEILENNYKIFYKTEKLQQWDAALGADPPYGDFDPDYYEAENPDLAYKWEQAVADDDLDIIGRYSKNTYYLYHYTTEGKSIGKRGNAVEATEDTNAYVEEKPTDADLQTLRDKQLGIDMDTQIDRIYEIKEIADEWEKAKNGDEYWTQLGKDNYLDVSKKDEFLALFNLSEREQDLAVKLTYDIETEAGAITDLEDAINEVAGEKALVEVKKFGALTQDVLKQAIDEIKKAEARNSMLSLYSGFGSFSDILNVNSELTNSILGDTGVGGILEFYTGDKAEESLEKQFENVTGIRNSVTYNWQKWFDETLLQKYQDDLEIGYSTSEAEESVKIEKDFASQFIEQYLKPRFNTAKSMNEFVEYLDVRQEEQNPFQTQDRVNALALVADLYADSYLDQLTNASDRYFDPTFYFNPTGDDSRTEDYASQAETVAADWEAAKAGDEYWAQQAYRFGVDVNDKEQFAKMHFQVKGQGLGYDAAEDILNASKVRDYIYNTIVPALEAEASDLGTVFGTFITPEEFADEMLEGLDPEDKSTWQDVLQEFGIEDFKGTVQELKDYISDVLRTGSAKEIREKIKYLNEIGKKPSQKELGSTYIERETDYDTSKKKGETALYTVFKEAGYAGTEDDFYEKFFPDLDRSEQQFLTKAGKGEALSLSSLELDDPFAAISGITDLLGDDEDTETTETSKKTKGYFDLESDEEESSGGTKSSGDSIFGELTSLFKGINV